MFGFGRKRIVALQTTLDDTRAILARDRDPTWEQYHALATDLSEALSAVHDMKEVDADPALEALVRDARALVSTLRRMEADALRHRRRAEDSAHAQGLISRLRLQRCRSCDATAFFVREHVHFETDGVGINAALVVCVGCGDMCLRVKSPEALKELADDPNYRYVELPTTSPFRG